MSRTIKHVVSVSSGKDSSATLLLALDRVPREHLLPIFCDTGNEHEAVYRHLEYLEQKLGITIHRLKADFTQQIARKRQFIANDRRTGRDKKGRKLRWSNKAKRRALAVLHPTGNPYIDLCLWKGRFPSRKAQFCTEELKRNVAVEFQLDLIDRGFAVISWQGVRRDESQNRRNAKKIERFGKHMYGFRPIVDWNADQVVVQVTLANGLELNDLYKQGMGRVGCMPCINVNKAELREIAARFPGHIDRIEQWETQVSAAGKRGFSTFLSDNHDSPDRREVFAAFNIRSRVEWSKTRRGGLVLDTENEPQPTQCSSSYGLCE
jgi:3'-phosphoadenosine 5'-phosphosulfate sulfotransferase (PAPS reductase)/FAD synthetase